METRYTSAREQVEYNLDKVDPERTVAVPVRDLLWIFQAFGELNQYFHQPMHYPTVEALNAFLGGRNDDGGYSIIHEAYYRRLQNLLPTDIMERVRAGEFEHPNLPHYFAVTD